MYVGQINMQNKILLQCQYKKNVEESITKEKEIYYKTTSKVVDLSWIAEKSNNSPKTYKYQRPR